MIMLISSKISGEDKAAIMMADSLKKNGAQCVIVNPHDLLSGRCTVTQRGGTVDLYVNDKLANPRVVYMLTQWRCDCILRIPMGFNYPAGFRMKIQQFLQDLRFAVEEATWFPGNYVAIERADSKPTLMKLASSVGLIVPGFTSNSFFPPNPEVGLYRKNLGFPFVVSLNKSKGCEVGVTTTNVVYDSAKHAIDGDVWQWQPEIKSSGQIRSFVVDGKIWSVIWKKTEDQTAAQDLREVGQVQKKEIIWERYKLPKETSEKLLVLMVKLGLSVAAPEFLVSAEGLVFIDLNPCGDWYGFFGETVTAEIVSALTRLLIK